MKRLTLFSLYIGLLFDIATVMGFPLVAGSQVTMSLRISALVGIILYAGAIRSVLRPDKFTAVFAIIFAVNTIFVSLKGSAGGNLFLIIVSMISAIGLWLIARQTMKHN